jgi:hypothetical protein
MVLPTDQITFIGVLLASFIVSSCINKSALRYYVSDRAALFIHLLQAVFSITGCVVLFPLVDVVVFLSLVASMFFWIRFTPSSMGMIRQAVVWLTMFIWLFCVHYTRPFMATIHISGAIMLLTIKYTSYAAECTKENLPDLVQWLGWTFFIPSFFTGPTISLQEYLKWVSDVALPQQEQQEYDFDKLERTSEKALTTAFWFAPFAILGTSLYPITSVTIFGHDVGVLYRLLYTWIALWCIKCRYYFLWGIAEASYIESGAARHVWHFGRNVEVWSIENAMNVHDITNNWNRCTAMWLKRNVYQPTLSRLTETMQDNAKATQLAVLVTNLTSAMWHGFSAGYYMTFIGTGICTLISRILHQHIDPLVTRSGSRLLQIGYKVGIVLWINVLMITFALPFQVHTFEQSWSAWRGLYFIGHIWAGLALILVLIVITRSQERTILNVVENNNKKD